MDGRIDESGGGNYGWIRGRVELLEKLCKGEIGGCGEKETPKELGTRVCIIKCAGTRGCGAVTDQR